MSSYIARVLLPDEHVVYRTELHWVLYTRGLLITAAGALLGHFGGLIIEIMLGTHIARELSKPLGIVSFLVIMYGTYELLRGFIHQISTELVITNRRVIAKYGFISTTSFELMIAKVEGANIDQTVLGRLLGFGTVLVKGTGGGISPIDHIAAPFAFQSALLQMMERAQRRESAATRND